MNLATYERVTKNEREIEGYFCHRLRRSKKTERKERERKREEREKERKTERETERKETGRRERARVPFATDSAETRNKTKTNNSCVMIRVSPPTIPSYYNCWRLKLEGETESICVCTKTGRSSAKSSHNFVKVMA